MRDPDDLVFKVWFAFCAVMALAMIGGIVFAIVELWPHFVGMLDRVGR